MNEFTTGRAVLSKAGHDKNRFFAVVGIDGDYVLIADGHERKIESPKRKNAKHLQLTNIYFTAEEMQANGRLKRAIKQRFTVTFTKED